MTDETVEIPEEISNTDEFRVDKAIKGLNWRLEELTNPYLKEKYERVLREWPELEEYKKKLHEKGFYTGRVTDIGSESRDFWVYREKIIDVDGLDRNKYNVIVERVCRFDYDCGWRRKEDRPGEELERKDSLCVIWKKRSSKKNRKEIILSEKSNLFFPPCDIQKIPLSNHRIYHDFHFQSTIPTLKLRDEPTEMQTLTRVIIKSLKSKGDSLELTVVLGSSDWRERKEFSYELKEKINEAPADAEY